MHASHETLQPNSELDPALHGLPIETVGQDDPLNPDANAVFPHVVHHGTKDSNFKLDDTSTHREAPAMTGARAGRGLYGASRSVSDSFGNGTKIELIPKDAHLLDLAAPEAAEPLSADFRTAYLEDFKQNARTRVGKVYQDVDPATIDTVWASLRTHKGLITADQVKALSSQYTPAQVTPTNFSQGKATRRLVQEVASQINTARLVSHDKDLSVRGLFGAVDSVNGPSHIPKDAQLSFDPMIDFLSSKGVDGALTVQTYKNRKDGTEESGVVFWRLDKVGDQETWQHRAKQKTSTVGGAAIAGVLGGNVVATPADKLASLKGAPVMDRQMAQRIESIAESKGDLVLASRMTKLAKEFLQNQDVDPLKVVINLANSSPELSAMLSAGLPSGKGTKLHEHIQGSLGAFELQFAHRTADDKERQLLRMAVVLDSIGKSTSKTAHPGDKVAQAKANSDIARSLLRDIDEAVLSREDKIFVSALVNQNIIEKRVSGAASEQEAKQEYQKLRQKLPPQYHAMLRRGMVGLYTSDAIAMSSYSGFTTAEGQHSSAPGNNDDQLVVDAGGLRFKDDRRKTISVIFS